VKQRKAARAVSIAAHAEAVAAQGTTVPEVTEPDPIGLYDLLGFDPPNTRRKTGRKINFFCKVDRAWKVYEMFNVEYKYVF
jgi:hypothetical protein